MAPHSSTLAWKIPWMEEPGRLQSMESLIVGHDWSDLAAAAAAAAAGLASSRTGSWCSNEHQHLSISRPCFPSCNEGFMTVRLSPLDGSQLFRLTFYPLQFSRSVMSDSLWPHGLQHARLPCPSTTSGACSNSCPLSWWCHPTISSSLLSCLQSFPASGSFPISQFFTSGGQSIGVSASTSVLPMNTQDRFPLGWTGWISLQSKGLSRVFSNTTVQKHQFFSTQLSL